MRMPHFLWGDFVELRHFGGIFVLHCCHQSELEFSFMDFVWR